MAHDQGLAQRCREQFTVGQPLEEKKMFGGIGFLLHGNMACGIHKDKLVVRVGPEHYQEALSQPSVYEFDITGRSMKGWIMIPADELTDDAVLKKWLEAGLAFARTLPAK